jgi:hypothetical protein
VRQRTVAPGFFSNEDLTALPALHRLAFAGLWCLADRSGRVEDRPRRVRVLLFPYEPMTDEAMESILEDLAGSGFIRRYEVDGSRFLAVENFEKHQHPHPKEKASVIPAPPKSREKVEPSRVKDSTSRAGPSVPSGPSGSSDSPPPVEPASLPAREADPEADAIREKCRSLLAESAEAMHVRPDVLLTRASKTPNGRSITSLDGCRSGPWLRTTLDRLVELRLQAEAQSQERSPRLQPTADQYAAGDASRQEAAESLERERAEWRARQ